MKILLVFILILHSKANAQNVAFKEIKLAPKSKFDNTTEKTIVYPILVTNNHQVDQLINKQIKEGALNLENEQQTAQKALIAQVSDGLINLSYEVTYKKNGILSLNVYMEGCGAHCSSWTTYFNFDLKTGKRITINDLLNENKIDSFKNLVLSDKIKALTEYKLEETKSLKNNNIDSSSYKWILDEVDNNCMKVVTIENFSLSNFDIKIIDRCEFFFFIRSQEPDYELKYSYKSIIPFLNTKFKNLLLK